MGWLHFLPTLLLAIIFLRGLWESGEKKKRMYWVVFNLESYQLH